MKLYDENGNSPITITSMPTDGWTGWITGKQVLVRFITDANPATVSTGWKIDSYQYQSKTDYNFFSRLDVATSAIINVIESTRGRVNWGIMGFGETNATPPMNASYNDDQQKQSIITALNGFSATGDSNIAESMNLVLKEFNSKAQQIHKDCNKNFVIVLSDGYADHDTLGSDWGSPVADYAALNAAEASQYHFTQDPFQDANPPADYYDDIAGFMYSHKYTDYTSIPADERADSADNIIVHNIGFSTESPMLKHASDLGGGIFLTAYSKSQLVNAFYSLGILIAEYTSYTAPVVSVDETNRVQSGDRLYMALFKPNAELYWTGNLKQYGFTYGIKPDCNKTTNEWYVVDRADKSATTCDGRMLPETTSFWSSGFDGGDVEKGGVGQVLYNNIPVKYGKLDTAINACDFRKIYTYDSTSGLVRVGTNTLTNTALNVSQDTDRYKIANYIYGYTYDAHTAATALSAGGSPLVEGSPVSKRWPLGPIIHSSPKIIDYLDANNDLVNRYIAVGANDGLLHVFNNDNGQEIFAFIPTEVLPLMKQFDSSVNNHPKKVYTVDGSPALLQFKDSSNVDKKLLVFGLRRGGRAYYALDITDNTNPGNWSVRWKVNNGSANMGELGYSFAMPRQIKIKISTDPDTYANYILVPGGYDTTEDKNDPLANYQLTTTHTCSMGRVIYILNADDGAVFQKFDYNNKSGMKYCFPADPTVVTGPRGVFLAAYMTDLYGQVWKLTYNSTTGFALNLIFKMNPMTDQRSDYYWRNEFKTWVSGNAYPGGTIAFSPALGTDIKNPRKTFYSPEVSYAGNCFTDVPVLYMGTGDREHPTFIGTSTGGYAPVKNGLYAFYDAEAYYKFSTGAYNEADYFTEKNLLNVTCGAMEPDLIWDSNAIIWQIKANIKTYLRESTKGWYLLFSELDDCYSGDNNVDFKNQNDHDGEKSISPITLFSKVIYAPTYQPNASNDNPCEYTGNGRVFAVNYCTGNAVYNFYGGNDDKNDPQNVIRKFTRLDRYLEIGTDIPSGVSIVIRHGKAAGFISVGGKIYPLPDIDMPGSMIPFYWKEYNN
uniref:VWFA domain-containing protein n=1 Tax=uncultured Desulfobacterium sp. TaxID=201089 RepID=E1Y8V8_9BACT|nr:hypothetical protein N47_A10310 [uncultured Desulfobacterium sp.]